MGEERWTKERKGCCSESGIVIRTDNSRQSVPMCFVTIRQLCTCVSSQYNHSCNLALHIITEVVVNMAYGAVDSTLQVDARVLDYLDDKLQSAADFDTLDELLDSVKVQQNLLKQQVIRLECSSIPRD